MSDTLSTLREQLRQLQHLHDTCALDGAAFEAAKVALERRVVDLVMATPDLPPAPAPAPTPAPLPAAVVSKAGLGLWAGAAVAVLVAAGLGYSVTGSPGAVGTAPAGFGADAAPAQAAAGAAQTVTREQIEAMVGKLEARLQAQPDDGEGWGMLGRTYMALKRYADASTAYQKALKLRPDDATLLADYADATAVNNDRKLEGEPTRLLERALKIDPDNLKALVLLGTAAYNRGDYAVAVTHWERVVKVGAADSPMVEMARGGAAEARERGKLPPTAAATPAGPAAATATATAGAAQEAAGEVSGTVRLAPALKALAAPEDTVFIFARPAEGARMPLAILRKQVKDLPFSFRLDDSLSMSPAARLSGAGRVIIGARISKSGQAAPQPGDLQGLSPVVAVGSQGVAVEITSKLP